MTLIAEACAAVLAIYLLAKLRWGRTSDNWN